MTAPVPPSDQDEERVGHGSACGCMFCVEYRRAAARNEQIPPHARMVVTDPSLSAHSRKNAPMKPPTCATKGCTRPGTDKPYDELPAICAEHAAEGDAALLAAVRAPAPVQPAAPDPDETGVCGHPIRLTGCEYCHRKTCAELDHPRSDLCRCKARRYSTPAPVPPATTGGTDEAEGCAECGCTITNEGDCPWCSTQFNDTRGEVERLCILFHDAYEIAAIEAGWETQERSRVPWADVPEANKATMRATIRAVLASDWLRERDLARDARTRADALREAADDPTLRLAGHSGISITRLRNRADQLGGAS